jgi:hypothetical protein
MSAALSRGTLVVGLAMLAACGGSSGGEKSAAPGDYSAAAMKACLEDKGLTVGFAGEGQVVIPNSAAKTVGSPLIVFLGPGFTVAFTESEEAANEVEATVDGLAAENVEPPNEFAAHRQNAVYWWHGSEPPSAASLDEIVGCLR